MGKKGPSIVSVVVASVLVDFLFVAPTFSLLESVADVVRLTVFSIVGFSIHHLVGSFRGVADQLRDANEILDARVQQRTAELTATNSSLAKEIEVRQQEELARKEVEHGLRVALGDVEQALKEKEILLRETQHRVKNNLQVINSLLSLQRNRIQDPSYRELFGDCQQRIRAIALVHQRLCDSPKLTSIDLTAYFRQLVEELVHTYFVGPGTVSAQVVVDETVLSLDRLVPCALIVNELVCNSLKYAFPNRPGEIRVEIRRHAGNICLTVADNGIGFSSDTSPTRHGIGLQIVNALVEQLGGTLEWTRQNGTAATVVFPERN
jgi:two-component sensor histidine kinase